jgi:putative transposase
VVTKAGKQTYGLDYFFSNLRQKAVPGAKQFRGLEDFMNITQTAVTNAANLALFMPHVSQVLMGQYRQADPNFSVLDLKAHYRGYRYVTETIQMLPQKPTECRITRING